MTVNVPIEQNSQLLNAITWRSHVPNFTQTSQEISKVDVSKV